jgi:hypothetical protein
MNESKHDKIQKFFNYNQALNQFTIFFLSWILSQENIVGISTIMNQSSIIICEGETIILMNILSM